MLKSIHSKLRGNLQSKNQFIFPLQVRNKYEEEGEDCHKKRIIECQGGTRP